MRAHYRHRGLLETDVAEEPFEQFSRWFHEAREAGLHEPNAMVLATADARGRPSTRTVLLKGYDRAGLVFFTNHGSRKGREIAENPHVSLLFPWHGVARQVIMAGRAEQIGRAETAAYFRTRPHGSQLGAWASEQSSVVASREELDRLYAELAARYPEGSDIPAPPRWGGYRVVPETVEFWQGRENRLHDRLRYDRASADGPAADGAPAAWTLTRLSP
ncbi:pyridoxamine 5'-phosphate oxidase [Streptomyces sp. TRM 70351]|uniref:pyridoxamine 5'-phosphate oxidase n=1 Tax=Streptomyces sp. TRM 70351 TaxID=3116552 RepID=UPI002E7C41A8|nr:pyridoxamine 5'-phosphate oxidase [Streptomyces sp. TRM 70351]MEE1929572.1 pyridoxamine 5'-phosphate oxidase [Streptomyces sp. TRM 70351]